MSETSPLRLDLAKDPLQQIELSHNHNIFHDIHGKHGKIDRIGMKKRKLKRLKKNTPKSNIKNDRVMQTKAENTARAASKGEPTIDYIGNFIFFSTPSGEGWMLDHRNNYALRLAEGRQILQYRIIETADRFQVEWKERFRIEGNLFIASRKGEETAFENYPVEAITGLIGLIKEKASKPSSPSTRLLGD